MARKMTEWPSKRGPITKIMPSDGCIGDTVPLAVGKWYDFHEFGWYMGNVGLTWPIYSRSHISARIMGQHLARRTDEMFSLTRILCRNWTRVLCCPNDQERPSQENEQKSHDDLTAIRGIGIATQDHLNKSGIWTYAQLAAASPDDLRETLSDRVTEGKTKHWIADARKLAEEAIK